MTEFISIERRVEAERSSVRLLKALGYASMSVYTLFDTPPHEKYHRAVEDEFIFSPQPPQPDIETTTLRVQEVLKEHEVILSGPLPFADKVMASAYMMQFTDHFTQDMEDRPTFNYVDMKHLRDEIVGRAHEQSEPLSYDQQLAVALDLSHGDIMGALTNLCYTSRQYARWLDGTSIQGLPDFTQEELLDEMRGWRRALLACKSGEDSFQDPAGDTYYTWTHALAAVMFGSGTKLYDRVGEKLFSEGTNIMHTAVHTFNKQGVPNDHRVAAAYGNKIGKTIILGSNAV